MRILSGIQPTGAIPTSTKVAALKPISARLNNPCKKGLFMLFQEKFRHYIRLFPALFLCGIAAAPSAVPVFQPTVLENKSYFEFYTVTVQHDDQTFIQMLMGTTNLGIVDSNATVKLLVLHTAEKSWKGSTYYDQKKWSYSDTPNPTLSIGSCKFRQLPGTIDCSGTIDGIKIHIVLEGVTKPVNVPHTSYGNANGIRSKNISSPDTYDYEVLLPWSKAHTTLTLPGQTEKVLEGSGMIEHARSVGNPRKVSRGWVTFRGNCADKYFLANFRLPPGKNTPALGWIWKEGASAPSTMEGLRISTIPKTTGGPIKELHSISAIDSSFCITGGEVLYRYSFIDDLGPVLGFLVQKLVYNLVTRYYDAQVQLSPESPPLKGTLELMSIE